MSENKYLPITAENLREVYINQCIRLTDLPEIFGHSRGKLLSVMTKNGINTHERKGPPQPIENLKKFESIGEDVFNKKLKTHVSVNSLYSKDEVYDLFIVQNKSLVKCAEHYGITKSGFRQVLRDFGIVKTPEAIEIARKEGFAKLYSDPERVSEMVRKAQTTMRERYGNNWYYNHTSKEESEVLEFVESILPDVEVKGGDYSIISRPGSGGAMQLDIYIPSLNFAIEYNGLYWHDREAYFEDLKNNTENSREALKDRLCSELGIELYHLWSDNWRNEKDSMKAALQSKIDSLRLISKV